MANTVLLKSMVEDYVRGHLQTRYGQRFSPMTLPLRPGGRRGFDAVSADLRIVASVSTASGLTSGGNKPNGKINKAITDIYYLALVDAPTRILVLTTPSFHNIFMTEIRGALAEGIAVECIPLPADMQYVVDRIVADASREMSPQVAVRKVADEVEAEAGL